MRTPGRETSGASLGGVGSGSAETLPSPWTSLAATAAGDVAAGAPFSPAQVHQIAAATAAAVAAAAAVPPPGTSADARYRTPRRTASQNEYQAGYRDAIAELASPSAFARRDADAADSPPTPARAAVARAEVALLEAKMEVLREELAAAATNSARMEARARAAASSPVSGEGAGERGEAGDEKDKNEDGAAEETEAPGVGSASVPFSETEETETSSRTAEKKKRRGARGGRPGLPE